MDERGAPQGPWTPDLLAEAISEIDGNDAGVDLRTVQLWFQDNEKGISAENLRWLARVFGCDDPNAVSGWQAELSAAQALLTARRRQRKRRPSPSGVTDVSESSEAPVALAETQTLNDNGSYVGTAPASTKKGAWLARESEAIFSRRSPLDVPVSVFTAAVVLGLLSYFLNIHSVIVPRQDGVEKQAGFLWAPNWTILFLIFMPLLLAFVADLVRFWRSNGRPTLAGSGSRSEIDEGWGAKVQAMRLTYWVVFIGCIGVGGVVQWTSVRLLPILWGEGEYASDWGSLAITRPDLVPPLNAIAFTGLAYLFMAICFYLYFAGLIVVYNVLHDMSEIDERSERASLEAPGHQSDWIRLRVIHGVCRCTLSGIAIAICMKAQSLYAANNAENILEWLSRDFTHYFPKQPGAEYVAESSTPTQYTSLAIALSSYAIFAYCIGRIRTLAENFGSLKRQIFAVNFVAVAFLLIGVFDGFSILLLAAIIVAIYGMFDPTFGSGEPT